MKRRQDLIASGTAQFKAPEGREPFDIAAVSKVPGPGEYLAEKNREIGPNERQVKTQAFGHKQKRFGSDETDVPGPGHYPAPDSCTVKDATRDLASYRSTTMREIHTNPKNIPGVGNFNANEQFALA